MKKAQLLSMAGIMSLFEESRTGSSIEPIQLKRIPAKTGNVLYDTINEINSHYIPNRYFHKTMKSLKRTKKGIQHHTTRSIKNAVQLRKSRLAISA